MLSCCSCWIGRWLVFCRPRVPGRVQSTGSPRQTSRSRQPKLLKRDAHSPGLTWPALLSCYRMSLLLLGLSLGQNSLPYTLQQLLLLFFPNLLVKAEAGNVRLIRLTTFWGNLLLHLNWCWSCWTDKSWSLFSLDAIFGFFFNPCTRSFPNGKKIRLPASRIFSRDSSSIEIDTPSSLWLNPCCWELSTVGYSAHYSVYWSGSIAAPRSSCCFWEEDGDDMWLWNVISHSLPSTWLVEAPFQLTTLCCFCSLYGSPYK